LSGVIVGLQTYPTQRAAKQPLIDFMCNGLRAAGCRVVFASPANVAPFVMTFETSSGERMGIVAYAFLATRTQTNSETKGERGFRIGYGSRNSDRSANAHDVWHDPQGLVTTIFLGIDPSEGFFVAADPEMHDPTKFFIRLRFSDADAAEIKRRRWYAWEREPRTVAGMDEPVEILVGGTRDRFLDLILFEQAAKGLPQGDRQLLAEKFAELARDVPLRTLTELSTFKPPA
jgi:hypothetical protein